MRNERGTSLVGILVAMGIGALVLLSTASWSILWLAGERMRDAAYDIQSHVQLARVEAIKRNQNCRFVLDAADRRLRVFETNRTAGFGDDRLLHEVRLPEVTGFSRPDAGEPITLERIGDSDLYQVVFTPDGSVESGSGDVVIYAGQRYGRVRVAGAGGVSVEHWNGSTWQMGS